MTNRLNLHSILLSFTEHVYFQPPSGFQMKYPCIVYNKNGKHNRFGNDDRYISVQKYSLTIIDRDPDSVMADQIEKRLPYCSIVDNFTLDNLNHTSLTLYY